MVIPSPHLAVPVQTGLYTLKKFIKNSAKIFKGTVELNKAGAYTLIMLKIFRAMQAPKVHRVKLASCVLEEEANFWWEGAKRINFVGRQIGTIS